MPRALGPVLLGLALLSACKSGGSPASSAEPGAAAAADESITNNQEQGVDEGGIVKAHGDHLIVLRRGRLFTVDVSGKNLDPVDALSVTPEPGHDAWYDEMLIHDDTIVVIGFSYQVGATEIGLFDIDDRGHLARRDTFFLNSNDYYSSRNYASRLVGDKLVFYMPYYLGHREAQLPSIKRWRSGTVDDWDRIIERQEIHTSDAGGDVLHTLVTCDLTPRRGGCTAQGELGGYGRTFYVSGDAVYVWTQNEMRPRWRARRHAVDARMFRFPLDGGRVGMLTARGAPVDQFSFSERGDHINVLVRAEGSGDAMWAPERSAGDVALLRVPVERLAGDNTATAADYVDLLEPRGQGYAFHNRFVGDVLLYGNGAGWGYAEDSGASSIYAHRVDDTTTHEVRLRHGIDRIEALGNDAVVIGSNGQDLHFTSMDLSRRPTVAGQFVQSDASQGELRSHGFFFKASGRGEGVLGLPVMNAWAPGWAHLEHGSAGILFLGVDDLRFAELGSLQSSPDAETNDQCITSCMDWYGNARPIFYRDRIFALLGYEVVEGRVVEGGIKEVQRADMITLVSPQARPALAE